MNDISTPDNRTPDQIRAQINDVESAIARLPQIELRVEHHFASGMYARELHIPAGVMLTGAVHLHEHVNILSQGEILVLTETGSQRLTAPATIVSPPGTKRLGYAVTDVVWVTVSHNPTNETDVPTLEKMLVVPNREALTDEQLEMLEAAQWLLQ